MRNIQITCGSKSYILKPISIMFEAKDDGDYLRIFTNKTRALVKLKYKIVKSNNKIDDFLIEIERRDYYFIATEVKEFLITDGIIELSKFDSTLTL